MNKTDRLLFLKEVHEVEVEYKKNPLAYRLALLDKLRAEGKLKEVDPEKLRQFDEIRKRLITLKK